MKVCSSLIQTYPGGNYPANVKIKLRRWFRGGTTPVAKRKPDGDMTERGKRLRLSQGQDKDQSRTKIKAWLSFSYIKKKGTGFIYWVIISKSLSFKMLHRGMETRTVPQMKRCHSSGNMFCGSMLGNLTLLESHYKSDQFLCRRRSITQGASFITHACVLSLKPVVIKCCPWT